MSETIPLQSSNSRGLLRVVAPAALEEHLAAQDAAAVEEARRAAQQQTAIDSLASFIRKQFDQFKRHRDMTWTERLLEAMRTFNGEYSPEKLAEIEKFGGSKVYARIIAMKCRGASSLLRDIYIAPDRPWGIEAPADPDVPDDIIQKIHQLIQSELEEMAAQGIQPPFTTVRDRMTQLMTAASDAEKKQARKRAKIAFEKMDELLEAGGFYKSLAEFLVDLPLFPFACIKGPVVRIVPVVKWENGQAVTTNVPRLFWNRVSPFDLYFSPGVSDIEDAAIIERQRLTRADLNDLLDLPGYNHEAVRAALEDYGTAGYADGHEQGESQRAEYENRENPTMNQSGMISCLEYNGNVQGQMLLDWGMDAQQINDPQRDYMVQAFLVGRYVIKVQLSPSPRRRHPYYISSFEKVPGTPVGNGLPDILSDIQDVANATLRSLVNNMSISSGPQVTVNDDVLAPGETGDDLYPWKRWHVQNEARANGANRPPIEFFQPASNAQELMGIYARLGEMADELSAIPRHMSGANPGGGAGRTASGLAMLMGNASKILQTVAANIDRDVIGPALDQLFDMIMLTDQTGTLHGDENIRVMGVNVAIQRETQRTRQLEFLQATANPLDAQILGTTGRAALLRSVAGNLGLDGETIVPPEDVVQAQVQQAQEQQAQEEAAAQAQGGQAPRPGSGQPRTNVT